MHPHLIKDLEMATYRQMPGLSKHELDNFAVAPVYYKWRKQQEWKPSRSMIMGTLVHSLCLEDRTEFAVGPAVDRRTKAGKEEWESFCVENLGKEIITEDEARKIYGVRDAVAPLLETVDWHHVEPSMFWERDGVACKGRPDIIAELGKPLIIDLKTTEDIQRFDQKFFSFRYHVQAAWYKYGIEQITGEEHNFWFLAVDMQEPHLAQFVVPSSAVLAEATNLIEMELEQYRDCLEGDHWIGLPTMRILMGRTQE